MSQRRHIDECAQRNLTDLILAQSDLLQVWQIHQLEVLDLHNAISGQVQMLEKDCTTQVGRRHGLKTVVTQVEQFQRTFDLAERLPENGDALLENNSKTYDESLQILLFFKRNCPPEWCPTET
jgi:hypothetical protein